MSTYLEDRFPHIVKRLEEAWGNAKAFQDVFNDLMFDQRGGRTGLPEEAWTELSWVSQLHKAVLQIGSEPEPDEPMDDTIKWVS